VLFTNCTRCRHVSEKNLRKDICSHCKAEDIVIQYQQKLFSFVSVQINKNEVEEEEEEISEEVSVSVHFLLRGNEK
jgi:hypothetical protein